MAAYCWKCIRPLLTKAAKFFSTLCLSAAACEGHVFKQFKSTWTDSSCMHDVMHLTTDDHTALQFLGSMCPEEVLTPNVIWRSGVARLASMANRGRNCSG